MTPYAQTIYEKLSELPVKEFFATPMLGGIFTNPWELLVDHSKERFLKLLSHTDDIPYEKMSDFQRFSAFVSGLSQTWGSGARELFFEELYELFGYEGKNIALNAGDMWIAFSRKMAEERYDIDGISRRSCAELFTGELLPIVSKNLDYEALVSRNLEAIDNAAHRCVSLDISSLNFDVTDRYHAREAYESFCKGEQGSIDTALSGIIYSIFDRVKKSNMCLLLSIGENYISAKKMIDYFAVRGVLPNTVVFASGDAERLAVKELCGIYESGKQSVKIEYGLIYNCGDTAEYIADRVCEIARAYPVGRLVVGGSVTDSPAFAARHRILRKGVCMAMSRICPESEDAIECAKKIIGNTAMYD